MNNIHIYTEVKRQSFSELAKAIERKRQNERRRIFTRRLQKEGVYTYRGVLQVMLVDIQLKCFRNLHCVYLSRHSIGPLVKHGKNGIINIVVNQYDPCSGFSYSVRHKGICIVTFAIIEDSLPARFILLELGEYFLELQLIFEVRMSNRVL